MESPVPKAAAIISVLIMIPTMMRAVWDLRRGIFRRPNLSITGLRQARMTIPAITGRKTAKRAIMMESMGMPNSSSILSLG